MRWPYQISTYSYLPKRSGGFASKLFNAAADLPDSDWHQHFRNACSVGVDSLANYSNKVPDPFFSAASKVVQACGHISGATGVSVGNLLSQPVIFSEQNSITDIQSSDVVKCKLVIVAKLLRHAGVGIMCDVSVHETDIGYKYSET